MSFGSRRSFPETQTVTIFHSQSLNLVPFFLLFWHFLCIIPSFYHVIHDGGSLFLPSNCKNESPRNGNFVSTQNYGIPLGNIPFPSSYLQTFWCFMNHTLETILIVIVIYIHCMGKLLNIAQRCGIYAK